MIDLDELDKAIERLERIKGLLKDIKDLQRQCEPFVMPPIQPTPMPYVPEQPSTNNPPWKSPFKIWC